MSFSVTSTGLEVPDAARDRLRADDVAARLLRKDATLWGPEAEEEASVRLGWLDLPASSRELVEPARGAAGRAGRRGTRPHRALRHGWLVAGAGGHLPDGGRAAGRPGHDRPRPGGRRADRPRPDRRRRQLQVRRHGGDREPAPRLPAPPSPTSGPGREGGRGALRRRHRPRLAAVGDRRGHGRPRRLPRRPNVGGRYSALSAFGLVPSALAGADVGALLDEAEELAEQLSAADNPALELGLAMGAAAEAGRDKLTLADGDSAITGFGDWAEQLIAESTGKQGRGILPVVARVGRRTRRPRRRRGARRRRREGPLPRALARRDRTAGCAVPGLGVRHRRGRPACSGSTRSTSPTSPRARRTPAGSSARASPTSARPRSSGPSRSAAAAGVLDGVDLSAHDGVRLALDALLASIPPRGYLALMAYLDRERDAEAFELRAALARRTEHAVTFGWAPRFLHSTGQYHKGGPADRRVPAAHRRRGGRPAGARPALHVRHAAGRPGGRRPEGPRRPGRVRCCTCT